jgi:hypothetical protein
VRRWTPLFVLLASALTFLASLFLPWRVMTAPQLSGNGVQGLLNHFAGGGREIDGWIGIAGDVAVLVVVATALATIAALRRPQLAGRLPIARLSVALGYFAIAVAVEVHTLSKFAGAGFTGHPVTFHWSWSYGFYVGLASAGIALLSWLAYRTSEFPRLHGPADAVAALLRITLLVSLLLPWFGSGPAQYSIHGIDSAAAPMVALVLIFGVGWVHGKAQRWRLPLAIATAVLTGGAMSGYQPAIGRLYGAWIGVGCAVALVALEAVRAWPVRLPVPQHGLATVRMAAAALLIVALFLPWREFHDVTGSATDGWYFATGAAAGSLCLLLLATPALPALENYVLDAAVAIVILVSALGTALFQESPVAQIGYGAFLGFAAAAILLVCALVPLRPVRVDPGRALARAVPLTASVLCVAAVVVPLWFVLPQKWTYQAVPLNDSLAIPGLLLAIYLVRLWALQVRGLASKGSRLTLVPLVLLTLPALELIRRRDGDVVWGAVILVGLCLLLAVFGWIEEDRGLESIRVPEEIWRVDRLPEADS